MLLLPWLVGVIWMLWLDSFARSQGVLSWPKVLGYGFFLGALILGFSLQVSYHYVENAPAIATAVLLVVAAVPGAFLIWREQRAGRMRLRLAAREPGSSYWLAGLLMSAIFLHLILAGLDVFSRQVFPWDALSTWLYRAKVWFLVGEIVPMQSATDWLAAGAQSGYTISAHEYPLTVSLIHMWPALTTGFWDDSLALMPTFFAGVAVALALYGQARQVGASIPLALLLAYLFLSIPLVDAHLALGGYADMWLAGFAGLGFIALVRWGINRQDWMELLLGIAMLVAAVFIKREGGVWLAMGLVLIVLWIVPWRWLLLTVVLLMLLWFGGLHTMELPFAGKLGFENGTLYVPFVGKYSLAMQNTGDAFIRNLFQYTTWNLLFVYLLLVLLLMLRPSDLEKRVLLPFLLLVIMVIGSIFGLSPEARWAADNTAVNRLIMQVTPALLFSLLLVWQGRAQALAAR